MENNYKPKEIPEDSLLSVLISMEDNKNNVGSLQMDAVQDRT